MSSPLRPIAFVLCATNHGSMILNRHDYRMVDQRGFGSAYQLLNNSAYDPKDIGLLQALLSLKRRFAKGDVMMLDGGANIGVITVECARHMYGWGQVMAIEAQERLFYALAGNIALNNCFNARARHAALGKAPGLLDVPQPDYHQPASFGSLEIVPRTHSEFIGQPISYDSNTQKVDLVSVDSLCLTHLDLFKLDVEGMEQDVLSGAEETIKRCRPVLFVEVIKSDRAWLDAFLARHAYRSYQIGMNCLAVHEEDPMSPLVRLEEGKLYLGQRGVVGRCRHQPRHPSSIIVARTVLPRCWPAVRVDVELAGRHARQCHAPDALPGRP